MPKKVRKRNESEDERFEVTRCICEHQELQTNNIREKHLDPGLFIQCETCHVWQHGYCVGFLSADQVPDVYSCERCRPDLHVIIVRPSGRTSRYEVANRKDPPRNTRRTYNSSRDEETLRRVLRESGGTINTTATTDATATDTVNPQSTPPADGSVSPALKLEDVVDESTLSSYKKSMGHSNQGSDKNTPRIKTTEKHPREAKSDTSANNHASESPVGTKRDTRCRKRRKASPRPDLDSVHTCKPRLPPSRASMSDLRKRATGLLEFVARTQLDYAAESRDRAVFLQDWAARFQKLDLPESRFKEKADRFHALLASPNSLATSMESLTERLLEWQGQFLL